MACLGEITCDSDIGAAPFIVADKGTITSAQEEITAVAGKVSEAITSIEAEISSGGLDEYSLYINGASPAYDEASKIITDLNTIKEDLEKIGQSYEQNLLEHYSKELDKYIEKVKEKIEELKKDLEAKESSLASKEAAYANTRNDPDRPSYKADIDALKTQIEDLKKEIEKYEKKLEEAEQAKSTTNAQIEKIEAAKIAEEEAKQKPSTTGDNSSDSGTSGNSGNSGNSGSYGPSYAGTGSSGGSSGSRSGDKKEEEEKKEEGKIENSKIKVDYDLDKEKTEIIGSEEYIKVDKKEQEDIDKYLQDLIKDGKVPKDFTGYFYDKANNRILYLTNGKLEKVNKPALIDGKFFYFKDGVAHILTNNYTSDNMNIPYYNLEKGLMVDGKTYTKEELAKLLKETPSLATSAAGVSYLIGRNVNPTELTNIQGWDYKANEGLNGLKLAEQYKVNAFTTNNTEYVTGAIKNGYPVSIAKEDGYVTVVGVDDKGNYKVLDPKNENSLTTTITKDELFKNVKKDSESRFTIYGAKSPEEYDKTKTNVTDIRQKTVDQTGDKNNNNQNQSNNEQNNNINNENTTNNNSNANNTNNGQDASNNTNNQNNNTNNENTANQNNNDNAQNNQNADNDVAKNQNNQNADNAANDAAKNQNIQNNANTQNV